ncbi:hypothetical protein GCM10027194_20550 [Thalassiella azotivora]
MRDAFVAAASEQGWRMFLARDTPTFCRLTVHGQDDVLVDLAIDAPPGQPPSASVAGPTFGREELAGRKLVALFDRAEARDFVDVYVLSKTCSTRLLLQRARDVNRGLDPSVLAQMFRLLDRYADDDLALDVQVTDLSAMRESFAQWAAELERCTD